MRIPSCQDLYKVLIDTEFNFIKNGMININQVYASVKKRYPTLCDDSYSCSDHCKSGNNQAEWKHVVRNVMQHVSGVYSLGKR